MGWTRVKTPVQSIVQKLAKTVRACELGGVRGCRRRVGLGSARRDAESVPGAVQLSFGEGDRPGAICFHTTPSGVERVVRGSFLTHLQAYAACSGYSTFRCNRGKGFELSVLPSIVLLRRADPWQAFRQRRGSPSQPVRTWLTWLERRPDACKTSGGLHFLRGQQACQRRGSQRYSNPSFCTSCTRPARLNCKFEETHGHKFPRPMSGACILKGRGPRNMGKTFECVYG